MVLDIFHRQIPAIRPTNPPPPLHPSHPSPAYNDAREEQFQ